MAALPALRRLRGGIRGPASRRFHAEPIACPDCGPRLALLTLRGGVSPRDDAALDAAATAIARGEILAVKGVGGYHLLVRCGERTAVARCGPRKHRPHKPFAVMFPRFRTSRQLHACPEEEALLYGPERPHRAAASGGGRDRGEPWRPACRARRHAALCPLHHLLWRARTPAGGHLGNSAGEPVLTDERKPGAAGRDRRSLSAPRPADCAAGRRFGLPPDRGRPADPPGRGHAPVEFDLPVALPRPMLAFGGQMKTTVALGWGHRP